MAEAKGLGQEGLMTVIEIELPEETAAAAREAGLLTPEALERLLKEAMRRQGGALLSMAREIQAAGVEPMTMEEVNEEVKAYRRERHMREGALWAGEAGGS